jgi:hypothetical protein
MTASGDAAITSSIVFATATIAGGTLTHASGLDTDVLPSLNCPFRKPTVICAREADDTSERCALEPCTCIVEEQSRTPTFPSALRPSVKLHLLRYAERRGAASMSSHGQILPVNPLLPNSHLGSA